MTHRPLEIRTFVGAKPPKKDAGAALSAALAAYARRQWPHNTRKIVASQWGLTFEESRAVVEGAASKTVIGHVLNGRWDVIVAVGEQIAGPLVDYLAAQREAAAARLQSSARLEGLAREVRQ